MSPLVYLTQWIDLFLVCEDPSTKLQFFQVWLNDRATESYRLKQSGSLPRGAGPITFADMGKSSLSCSFSSDPLSLILAQIGTAQLT
jgi:hypothetical protein